MRVVLVDLDGTLADVASIEHHVNGPKRKFDLFHELSLDAPINEVLLNVLLHLVNLGIGLVVVSGRSSRWLAGTKIWLDLHEVPYTDIYLRKHGDSRPDYEVKEEMLRVISSNNEVVLAFEDNPKIMALWKSKGIPIVYVKGSMNQYGENFGATNV